MKVLSIFTMGSRRLGGSGGMLDQKILKIRYLRLVKIDMKNATKFNHAVNIFTQKWSKKRITPQDCFTNTRLKNNNFTSSRTKTDSITYHDQTFNHDITHKIHKIHVFKLKNYPKTHYAKILGGPQMEKCHLNLHK